MLPNNENFGILKLLFELCLKSSQHSFINGEELELIFKNKTKYLKELKKKSVAFEEIRGEKIRIRINQFGFNIFYDRKHFFENLKINVFTNDIGILLFESNDFAYYEKDSQKTYSQDAELTGNYFFENYYYYLKTLNFIETKQDNGFIDYFNPPYREIILTSPAQKGKLIIGYKTKPNIDPNIRIQNKCKKFYSVFESKEFPKFFKNELFKYLDTVQKEERYETFLNKLDSIYESAERNFDIYLNGFSFDKLQRDFEAKKENYLESFRSIISKLTNQVIGLPLSISASVFAAYEVQDSPFILLIILLAFVIYNSYLSHLLKYYKADLLDLEERLDHDLRSIQNSVYYQKHVEDFNAFSEEIEKLKRRVINLRLSITIFFGVIVGLTLLFTTFIFYQMLIQLKFVLLYNLLVVIFLILIYLIKY